MITYSESGELEIEVPAPDISILDGPTKIMPEPGGNWRGHLRVTPVRYLFLESLLKKECFFQINSFFDNFYGWAAIDIHGFQALDFVVKKMICEAKIMTFEWQIRKRLSIYIGDLGFVGKSELIYKG